MSFIVVEGSPGLTLDEVPHIIIPGYGHSPDMEQLSIWGLSRVQHAASLYSSNMLDKNGYIVPCGDKSPGIDSNVFESEAILAQRELVKRGIPTERIRPESHSIDSVTNLANVEAANLLPNDEPVAIVAHEKHLKRIMDIIAPKILRRDYLGVVVPVPKDWPKEPEGLSARLVTRAVTLGISKSNPDAAKKSQRRAELAWKATNSLLRITDYHQQ